MTTTENWDRKISEKLYSENILRKIVGYVDLRTLIKTQKLSLKFIHDVILNPDDDDVMSSEERCISLSFIAYHQNYTVSEILNYRPS
jgi:hypothetical protein